MRWRGLVQVVGSVYLEHHYNPDKEPIEVRLGRPVVSARHKPRSGYTEVIVEGNPSQEIEGPYIPIITKVDKPMNIHRLVLLPCGAHTVVIRGRLAAAIWRAL